MKVEVDRNYRWRRMRLRIAMVLVSLALLIAGMIGARNGDGPFNIWTLLFLASVVVGLVFEFRLKGSYSCPRCGARLGFPKVDSAGGTDEYFYECGACSIQWRTRAYPPTPSG